MIERLLILIMFCVVGYVGFRMYQAWQMRRLSNHADDPILSHLRADVPAIIYFTTPHCMPCKTVQQPALETLRSEMGEALQIVQIDATTSPHLAQRWGVMTAPTTFVLDSRHQAKQINYGAVDAQELKQQLARFIA